MDFAYFSSMLCHKKFSPIVLPLAISTRVYADGCIISGHPSNGIVFAVHNGAGSDTQVTSASKRWSGTDGKLAILAGETIARAPLRRGSATLVHGGRHG